MRRVLIAVVGPGEGAPLELISDAREVGTAVAAAGWALVTGGLMYGVMDAASRGAQEAGGLVLAVIPGTNPADATPHAEVVIPTGLGEGRDALLAYAADAMVVCGMSSGTAAEVALALRMGKPVVLVRPENIDAEFFHDLAPDAPPHVVADADEVVRHLRVLLA
jgi:hypothetical protein